MGAGLGTALGLVGTALGVIEKGKQVFKREKRVAVDSEAHRRIQELEKQLSEIVHNDASKRDLEQILATLKAQETVYQAKLQANEEKMVELAKQAEELQQYVEEGKISSFEDLKKHDAARFNSVMTLATAVPPRPMQSKYNVGFIGSSGTGKSTLINKIIGVPGFLKTAVHQCTEEIKECMAPGNSNVAFFDIPGKTDRITYFSASMIGFLKSFQFVGLTVLRTVDDIADMCTLLDHLQVKFVVLVTQMDTQYHNLEIQAREENSANVQQFIQGKLAEAEAIVRKEVTARCARGANQPVFRISSRATDRFDWVPFVNCMYEALGPGAKLARPA